MSIEGVRFFGVAAKMTRRLAAVVLVGQALAIFFGALVAEAVARADGDDGSRTYLWFGLALAVLSLLTSGTLRRPWGIALGWAVQAATVASALVVPAMVIVGGVFLALWITALAQGAKMDQLTREFTEGQGSSA